MWHVYPRLGLSKLELTNIEALCYDKSYPKPWFIIFTSETRVLVIGPGEWPEYRGAPRHMQLILKASIRYHG